MSRQDVHMLFYNRINPVVVSGAGGKVSEAITDPDICLITVRFCLSPADFVMFWRTLTAKGLLCPFFYKNKSLDRKQWWRLMWFKALS